MNKQIKFTAYNPTTRKSEEVFPEDEFDISEVTPLFLCDTYAVQGYVTLPDYEAAWVYDDWLAQFS